MSFVFDAWAGKSEEELKADLRRLNRAVGLWQRIAMALASNGGQVETLPEEWKQKITNLIASYEDYP